MGAGQRCKFLLFVECDRLTQNCGQTTPTLNYDSIPVNFLRCYRAATFARDHRTSEHTFARPRPRSMSSLPTRTRTAAVPIRYRYIPVAADCWRDIRVRWDSPGHQRRGEVRKVGGDDEAVFRFVNERDLADVCFGMSVVTFVVMTRGFLGRNREKYWRCERAGSVR